MGAKPPPKRGFAPQFRKCLCLYIDSPHPKPVLVNVYILTLIDFTSCCFFFGGGGGGLFLGFYCLFMIEMCRKWNFHIKINSNILT